MTNNETSYTLAVRAYSDDLFRYAYWLCRHHARAEDLVQEALMRAWKHWHSVHDPQMVKAWLFQIVRREFLRSLTLTQREALNNSLDETVHDLPQASLDPADTLALQQLILRAPTALREALVLQVVGGFSSAEIAQLQDSSEGAVMTRLTRARQWLRRAWQHDERKEHNA